MNDIDSIIAEILPEGLGVFSRFPPQKSTCITCPPGRTDPFLHRVIWRALLPFLIYRILPKKKPVIFALAIPALAYGLITESIIETIYALEENMSALISGVAVLALVIIPSYLLMKSPALYNVPVQILFSVFLTAASTWLGISINNKRAKRDATAKWLPAAETACKQLLTLSATAERMKKTQVQSCSTIDPLIPDDGSGNMKPLKAIVALQCRETAEKLATLRDHIENSISHWQVFIGTNCEGNECQIIDQRLQACRHQLFTQIDAEQCSEIGVCQNNKAQQTGTAAKPQTP